MLVTRVNLGERIPALPSPVSRGRGRPPPAPDRLLVQALVLMIVRPLHTVPAQLSVLAQPTPELQPLWAGLPVDGRLPTRRPWERRRQASPAPGPTPIGCLGRALVARMPPWARGGRAAAIDRTVLRARGGVWHQKDREAGLVPHPAMATPAHGPKAGWPGGGSGGKLPLVTTGARVWIPRAAEVTAAKVAANEQALTRRPERPADGRSGLGDHHDNAPALHVACAQTGQTVVAPRRGPYPHPDAGVEVRRLRHERRSRAIENLNEPFKGIFDVHGQVPTRGLVNTRRVALGAVFVYQLTRWDRHEHGLDLRVGLKPFLQAA